MVKSRLLLVLALITVAVNGTFGGGASARASELDGEGLHCESTTYRRGLYTEGCAAVGAYRNYSYIFGQPRRARADSSTGSGFRPRMCWSASHRDVIHLRQR
jgi:hypothetical protein